MTGVSHSLLLERTIRLLVLLPPIIVTCLNVIARFDYRSSIEALEGFSPDISRHKIHFWETVLRPTVWFPESPWKAEWFNGFADGTGDGFTYNLWTCRDPTTDDYLKGRNSFAILSFAAVRLPRHPHVS